MAKFGVIIVAAGTSSRFGGDEKKQFEELAGRAVFLRAMQPLLDHEEVGAVVVAVAEADLERVRNRWGSHLGFHGVKLVAGGAERVDSVAAGLAALPDDCDHVAIHDAARPLLDVEVIDRVFKEARMSGAAIPAIPLSATLKKVNEHKQVEATVPREGLWQAQTPQAFRRQIFADALAQRDRIDGPVTDDAQLVEAVGHPVTVVMGRADNFKITTAGDLLLAKEILRARGDTGPRQPPKHHRF
jgi:2-C-methyl-D-erythritol 4-phosphate cytidylyltransferase